MVQLRLDSNQKYFTLALFSLLFTIQSGWQIVRYNLWAVVVAVEVVTAAVC